MIWGKPMNVPDRSPDLPRPWRAFDRLPEPLYGLAVIGIARKKNIRRNDDAQVGDALILTKPLRSLSARTHYRPY